MQSRGTNTRSIGLIESQFMFRARAGDYGLCRFGLGQVVYQHYCSALPGREENEDIVEMLVMNECR